jgi:hypothetical protein
MSTRRFSVNVVLAAGPLLVLAALAANSCSNENLGQRSQAVHLADLPECSESWCSDLNSACQGLASRCAQLYSLNATSTPTWCGGWVTVTGAAVRQATGDPATLAHAMKTCMEQATLCAEANTCPGLTLFPNGGAEPGLKSEPYPPEDYNPPKPLPTGGFPKPEHPEPDQGGSTVPNQPDTCVECALDGCPVNDKVCFAIDLPPDPTPGEHLGNIKQCDDYRACLTSCAEANQQSWPGFYLCADSACRTPFSNGNKHDFSGVQSCASAKCGSCAPTVQFTASK